MTEDIEDWMMANGVKRIVNMSPGWAVYLQEGEAFGTGKTILQALGYAERMV
jgi:hypothetical protein